MIMYTLQGINISHLGKRKIIFKMPFLGDMLVSWRVMRYNIMGLSLIMILRTSTDSKKNVRNMFDNPTTPHQKESIKQPLKKLELNHSKKNDKTAPLLGKTARSQTRDKVEHLLGFVASATRVNSKALFGFFWAKSLAKTLFPFLLGILI